MAGGWDALPPGLLDPYIAQMQQQAAQAQAQQGLGQMQNLQNQLGSPPQGVPPGTQAPPPGPQTGMPQRPMQLAADQPTPFGPQGSGQGGQGMPQQQMYEDFARRAGRPEWFGGQGWQGPMRMTPGSMGHPANEAMLQQMLRAYGIA